MNAYLDLHKDIYSQQCIQRALEAYKDLASITVVSHTDYWRCEFSACVNDEQVTIQEFENYCVGLIGSKRIVSRQ